MAKFKFSRLEKAIIDAFIEEKSHASIYAMSRTVDWGTISWVSSEAAKCDHCGEVCIDNEDGTFSHSDCQACGKCEVGHFFCDAHKARSGGCNGQPFGSAEGPLMNYFYPCEWQRDLSMEEAAKAIVGLPLCVVEVDDQERGFALTGGGMDYSWEICLGYIKLGHLPPVSYILHSSMPHLARVMGPAELAVVNGLRASLVVSRRNAKNALNELVTLELFVRSMMAGT